MMKWLKTADVVAGVPGVPGGRQGERDLANRVNRVSSRVLFVALVASMIFAPASAAGAVAVDEFSTRVDIDTVILAPEGSVTVLATRSVDDQYAGQLCTVTGVAENQDSIHPNSNLILASGGTQVVLEDVESAAFDTVTAAGQITLGSQIVISLVIGPDEVFSADMHVLIDCVVGSTTTTTTTTVATTTTEPMTSTTNPVETTSTVEPPEETTSTADDEVLGTVVTSSTVGDEVEDLEVLPFTGSNDGALLLLAGAMLVLGVILLVGTRRDEG